MLDLARNNLLSPVVLCFVLGAVAAWVRSDLRFPEPVFSALSIYLMLSIGLRGGAELAGGHLAQVGLPALGALLLGCAIPLWCYALLRGPGRLGVADAAALAAHYGSVSAVTFAAVQAMLDRQGTPYDGFAAALLAIMEVPAIVVALVVARLAGAGPRGREGAGGAADAMREALREVLSGKSVVLLAGGLLIGALSGPAGIARVKPLFSDLFQGALCLFLLDLGRAAAERARDFARVGLRLALFALAMPVLHAGLGILVGRVTGLS